MEIGTSSFEGTKSNFFKIEPNKDNLFRILPPLFSLAAKQEWAYWTKYHSIWVTNAGTGKKFPYHFNCPEVSDWKTKVIKVPCDFCNIHKKNSIQLAKAKESGQGTKEQLTAFENTQVRPFVPTKKFKMNAVNEANDIGILEIGYKLHGVLKALMIKTKNDYQIDPTGMNGLYLNFNKNQAYVGDRDTSYTVVPAYEAGKDDQGRPTNTLKPHSLTPDFISRMEGECKDLSTIVQSIDAEDIRMLSEVKPGTEEQTTLLDRIFGRSEKVDTVASIGGTNSTSLGTTTLSADGVDISSPLANATDPAALSPDLPWETEAPAVTPEVTSAPEPEAPPATVNSNPVVKNSTPPAPEATMSDEAFMAAFGTE